MRRLLISIGHVLFRYRNGLFPVIFICLAVASEPRYAWGDARLDRWVDAVGVGVGLLGQLIRIGVIGLAYIQRGGLNRKIYATELVEEGVFAHCRNPLYVGNFLILLGLIVIHNGAWCYLVGIPLGLLVYTSIVLAEEEYLYEQFGAAYGDYCRRVPRFRVRLAGLASTLRGAEFDWKKVLRKEYGTPFGWITAILVLFVWQDLANGGAAPGFRDLLPLVAVWLVALAGWTAVRFLKKAGRLGVG